MEKLLWAVAIVLASAGMVYCCISLSNRFRASKLSTVFETTSYKVTEIPFAAVTLCNNNRINYNKTDEALNLFLPNHTEGEAETFVAFVHILQNQEFGSFDEYEVLKGHDVTRISKLNVSKVYEFMMHDCEVFFVSCWWRGKPFKCCDLFSKQRTEYGICYSFNSHSNVGSEFVDVRQINDLSYEHKISS